MELRMEKEITDLVPGAILFNYEELKAEISGKLAHYRNLAVTEADIANAKKDRAALSRLAEALNSQRISQQREYLRPFEEYKSRVDELIGMVKEPVEAIDRQLREFERIRREEKLARLTACYRESAGALHLENLIPLEKVLDPKWANAGKKEDALMEDIRAKVSKAYNDLKIIGAMNLACETQVKDAYLRNLDMSDALAEKARFEERERQLAAVKEREQRAARPVPAPEPPVAEEPPVYPVFVPEEPEAPSVSYIRTIRVVFYDTTADFRAEMKALTQKHKIRYGGIADGDQ